MTALLERFQLPEYKIEPVYIGPTWKRDEAGAFMLPKWTLGWQALHWARKNLNGFDGGELRLTSEQVRFILWWFAIDERGRYTARTGVLQRLKGWGKDPIVAIIAAIEFLGPCRFEGWARVDMPEKGIYRGDPVAKENPAAWIQIAAVSQEQTKNTMSLFPALFNEQCMADHGMNKHSIGQTVVYAHRGARRIQAVTSSPRALEGGRPTFVVQNETHHWVEANDGIEMAEVIQRNVAKSKNGGARVLSITNAFEPSEESVARLERETWAEQEAGLQIKTGVLYDSIEAPADAGMGPARPKDYVSPGPEDPEGQELEEREIRAFIGAVIDAVRGDASWLNVEDLVNTILTSKKVANSRRFYYNQIVADEDAWVDHGAVDAAEHPVARGERARARQVEGDLLRCGWNLVAPDEPVVLFSDHSKTDDATGIVGVRLSDFYTFVVGVWTPPRKTKRGANLYQIPRETVSARIDEAMERFNVVAYWGDPSHAKDDTEDAERYWDPYFDRWHRKHGEKFDKRFWAVGAGHKAHSIMWDMANPLRIEAFTAAAMRVAEELETRDEFDAFAPRFRHDGNPALMEHFKNARVAFNKWGESMRKEGRESAKKIDLAVCAVGAQMLAQVVLNLGIKEEQEHDGTVY